MGGVSGAFLLLPFQVSFLGFTHPSVSATNQLYNIVAIPVGAYRTIRSGRMSWSLFWLLTLGTLPGVFMGYVIRVLVLGTSIASCEGVTIDTQLQPGRRRLPASRRPGGRSRRHPRGDRPLAAAAPGVSDLTTSNHRIEF